MGQAVSSETAEHYNARYVAIIADGNHRWAEARGLPVSSGHQAAAETLQARIRDFVEFGIEELTVYSFSTENWARPVEEVHDLLSMFTQRLAQETPALCQADVRIHFIGRRANIPGKLLNQMRHSESLTKNNRGLDLFIALNYGGRAEILDAAKHFHGTTEEEFRRCLYAPDMHDPDLIIRTGSERRLSNYLLWQSAYSELIFRDEPWPDFTRQSLAEALSEFSSRGPRQHSVDSPALTLPPSHSDASRTPALQSCSPLRGRAERGPDSSA
jgi:undecaprenyl diphosphate synthase